MTHKNNNRDVLLELLVADKFFCVCVCVQRRYRIEFG